MDCAGPLASDWSLPPPQVQAVMEAFRSVVGGGSDTSPAAPSPAPTSPQHPVVQPFQPAAQGMPASEALRLFAQLGNGQFSHDDRCFSRPTSPGSCGRWHWPAPSRREKGDSLLRGRGGHNPLPGGGHGSRGGLREALSPVMAGGGAPGRWRAGMESLPDFIFPAERQRGPPDHSHVASDSAGRSQGGVGDGAGHACSGDPLDHTGAARHATHCVAANGAVQPPVVGEG